MQRVKRVKALVGYRLEVVFSDGRSGEVDVSDRLFGPMFAPLRDRQLFDRAFVDEFGAVCWPNGADLAPDALYEQIVGATSSLNTETEHGSTELAEV